MTYAETNALRERLYRRGETIAEGECRTTWWLLDDILYFQLSHTQIQWSGTPANWARDKRIGMWRPLDAPDLRLLAALEERFPEEETLRELRARHNRLREIPGL